jgi:hypothetical protein
METTRGRIGERLHPPPLHPASACERLYIAKKLLGERTLRHGTGRSFRLSGNCISSA